MPINAQSRRSAASATAAVHTALLSGLLATGLAAGLLLVPLGSPLRAQEAAPSTFLDRVEVNVVNVEVFVVDRQGNPVSDLTRDDFELRVDGEPLEISNFYVSRGAPPAGGGSERIADLETAPAEPGETADETAGAGAAPAPADAPQAATADERPLNLVVYFDNVHIQPQHRKRVLDDLRPLVAERAAAGDQVMLVTYDGGVEVVTPFTGSAEQLAAGLDEVGRSAALGHVALRELQTILRTEGAPVAGGGPNAPPPPPSTMPGAVEAYAAKRMNAAQGSLKALESTVRSLAGLPGRKAVIYVSDGIPRSPGILLRVLNGADPGAAGTSFNKNVGRMYREVVRQANAHEITLYPLDARGPNPNPLFSPEFGNLGLAATDAVFAHNTSLREPLLDMAHGTGGRAILNTFNFDEALERVVADFETYYSLGFLSPFDGDGEYHDVQVRVKGRGLTARHRSGYLDKAPADRVADRARSFLLQGWESNTLGISLSFGSPEKQGRHWRVPVVVGVPRGSVTLIPQGDRLVGEISLFVAVRDEQNRLSEVTRLPHDISLPNPGEEAADRAAESGSGAGRAAGDGAAGDGAGQTMGYSVEVDLRSGLSSLLVAVWDELGGTESYVVQRVQVGEDANDG